MRFYETRTSYLTRWIKYSIIKTQKGKTSNGYAKNMIILYNNRLARGGYCAFTAKIINNMIPSRITLSITRSNSFAICSSVLTFHKHSPFHKGNTAQLTAKALARVQYVCAANVSLTAARPSWRYNLLASFPS